MNETSVQNEKFLRMTTAPVEGLICRLALPAIIVTLITAMYNMADTFFVSFLGTSATAAVGIVFPLMAVIQAVGFMFGHGSGNYISRELGAQRYDNASKMAATGFVSALIAGGFISLFGNLFIDSLARSLGASDSILPHARDYIRFILLGAPFMASSLMLNNLLRYQGSAFYGMIGMVSGALINIGLDPLFIFVLNLGTSGASLATMLSQTVSFSLLLLGCTKSGNVRINPKDFSPSPALYREIFRGGFPSLCRQGLASVAAVFVNQQAVFYGDAAVAALSIVHRVTLVAQSALVGFGQGFQPVCGFNYGARRYDRVRRAFWFCNKVAGVPMLLLAIGGFIFAPRVIGIFQLDDPRVMEIGTFSLRLPCWVFPLRGWFTLSNMMMQTIGRAFRASLLAVSRQGLFLLPLLFILAPTLGLLGIQLTQPCADAAAFLLSLPLCIGVLREMKQAEGGMNRTLEDGKAGTAR
jgi:putative MATE family efflux protein